MENNICLMCTEYITDDNQECFCEFCVFDCCEMCIENHECEYDEW